MTLEDTADDDEVVHGKEDALYLEFIEFIANESVSYPRLWLLILQDGTLKHAFLNPPSINAVPGTPDIYRPGRHLFYYKEKTS